MGAWRTQASRLLNYDTTYIEPAPKTSVTPLQHITTSAWTSAGAALQHQAGSRWAQGPHRPQPLPIWAHLSEGRVEAATTPSLRQVKADSSPDRHAWNLRGCTDTPATCHHLLPLHLRKKPWKRPLRQAGCLGQSQGQSYAAQQQGCPTWVGRDERELTGGRGRKNRPGSGVGRQQRSLGTSVWQARWPGDCMGRRGLGTSPQISGLAQSSDTTSFRSCFLKLSGFPPTHLTAHSI